MRKFFALLALTLVSISFAQAENEETTAIEGDGISKKWEFKFDVGATIGARTKDDYGITDHDDNPIFEVGVGYNFNSHVFLGLNSGYFWRFGNVDQYVKANNYIPVLADFVYRWNVGSKNKWSIFLEGRGGYMFAAKGDATVKNTTYEYPNAGYFDIQPGIYYRLKKNIDIRFSIGYSYYMPGDDGKLDLTHYENMINAKLGMNFRSAPKAIVRTTPIEEPVAAPVEEVKQEPVPTTKIVETTTEEQRQLGEREVVIYYLIRQHNILPEKDALLQELADFAKTHKTTKVIVKSYADKGTGNYKLNQMYSRNRMNEVRKHLIEKYGIPADQIESSYYGDTVQPYEENDLNRCSIIVVKEIE